MGVTLFLVRYEYLFGSMTKEEQDFMSSFDCDDGTYGVSEEGLEEAKNNLTDEQWLRLQTLVHVLEEAIQKAEWNPISLSMS